MADRELSCGGKDCRPAPPRTAALVETVQAVCAGLLGIRPEPCEKASDHHGDIVVAIVRYAGAWSGSLTLRYGVFEAVQLAHRLLGPADDILAHAVDLVGEIANMIAGHLKVALTRGVDTSAPEVAVFPPELAAPDFSEPQVWQCFSFGEGALIVCFQID
jgi:CheY-specific phosphatase CheX